MGLLDSAKQLSQEAKKCSIYHPVKDKTKELAEAYSKTDQLLHRYLAYRDLPDLFQKYSCGGRALDFGCGTGISTDFLEKLGLDAVGADINPHMIEKARIDFPKLNFVHVDELLPEDRFDLVFSSFVLFDMKTKDKILQYLRKVISLMSENGMMIAITGSEELYSYNRNWVAFDSKFQENRHLSSGNIARLRATNLSIEFYDYYWKEKDYYECFDKANLELLQVHKPTGTKMDPYLWKDEMQFAPFTVYLLKKQ